MHAFQNILSILNVTKIGMKKWGHAPPVNGRRGNSSHPTFNAPWEDIRWDKIFYFFVPNSLVRK